MMEYNKGDKVAVRMSDDEKWSIGTVTSTTMHKPLVKSGNLSKFWDELMPYAMYMECYKKDQMEKIDAIDDQYAEIGRIVLPLGVTENDVKYQIKDGYLRIYVKV